MRFASHLQNEAAKYRIKYLASDDTKDGTEVTPDWRDSKASFILQQFNMI